MPNILPKRSEEEWKALEIAEPRTPKSERPRRTWGSLAVSVQTVRGLCPVRKCVRKENHAGDHWPAPTA